MRVSVFGLERRSVRTRLMVWNIGVVALLLALLGAIVQITIQTVLQGGVDSDLKKSAKGMIGQARDMLLRDRGIDVHGDGPRGPGGPGPGDRGLRGPGRRGREDRGSGGPDWPGRDRGPGGPPPPGPGPPPDGRGPSTQSSAAADELRRQSYNPPRIFNLDGTAMRPFQKAGAWDSEALHRAFRNDVVTSTVTIESEPVRVVSTPVVWRGQVVGAVQAAHPLTDVRQAITSVNQTLLALIPVGLLFAGFAGAGVTGRALKPVGQIAQTADRIDAQDLSQRLVVIGSDEFSHLASTVNRMLGRLEDAFTRQRSLVRQLETLLEEQKRFTADASHELKTPLSVAKVHAGLLLHTRPTEEEYRESVESIDDAVNRMSTLVQDLLLLAQSDAGQIRKGRTTLVVRDLLERSLAQHNAACGAPVCLDPVDTALTVTGNEDQLVRVFSNLIGNALRHTPAEGEIRVHATGADGHVVVSIADTGEGIAPEHLLHLGERFYRVDSARSRGQGGVGLGLSICKSLLEQHGGSLSFESALGKGTTAIVTLPS